jgi:hypothetical protein
MNDLSSNPLWEITLGEDNVRFIVNKEHPVLEEITKQIGEDTTHLLQSYLKALEAYLPLTAIQAHMISEPHKIKQEEIFNEEEISELASKLRTLNLSEERIAELLKTEMFKNRRELLADDK